MPSGDGTGPMGMGPKTGRQMGKCEGAEPVGRGLGPCGRGLARGFGRGFGFRQLNPATREDEITALKYEKGAIEKRLKELEKQKK
ncbi:MAG: DUF5320 domain-containing protein [Candidatus Aenigmarchaeota archaeon]|nr:DUF5320 domain-containing protein [Candidatus Aenigmarchaeota archaeon]